jgi:hypothetical protein
MKNAIYSLFPIMVFVFGLLIGSCSADYESESQIVEGNENEAL